MSLSSILKNKNITDAIVFKLTILIFVLNYIIACEPTTKVKLKGSPLPDSNSGATDDIEIPSSIEEMESFNFSNSTINTSIDYNYIPLSTFGGINITGRDINELTFSYHHSKNLSKGIILKYLIQNEVSSTIEHIQGAKTSLLFETNGRTFYALRVIEEELFIHSGKNISDKEILLSKNQIIQYEGAGSTNVEFYSVNEDKNDQLNVTPTPMNYILSISGVQNDVINKVTTDKFSGGVALNNNLDYALYFYDEEVSSFINLDFTGAIKTELHADLTLNGFQIQNIIVEGSLYSITIVNGPNTKRYSLYGYKSGNVWLTKQVRHTIPSEDPTSYEVFYSNQGIIEIFSDNKIGKYIFNDDISIPLDLYLTNPTNAQNVFEVTLVRDNKNICLGKTGEYRCLGADNLNTSHIIDNTNASESFGSRGSFYVLFESGKLYEVSNSKSKYKVYSNGFTSNKVEQQLKGKTIRYFDVTSNPNNYDHVLSVVTQDDKVIVLGDKRYNYFGTKDFSGEWNVDFYYNHRYNYILFDDSSFQYGLISPFAKNFINTTRF